MEKGASDGTRKVVDRKRGCVYAGPRTSPGSQSDGIRLDGPLATFGAARQQVPVRKHRPHPRPARCRCLS